MQFDFRFHALSLPEIGHFFSFPHLQHTQKKCKIEEQREVFAELCIDSHDRSDCAKDTL